MSTEDTVTFPARDGTLLTGSLFRPSGTAHTALLVNSGTGIPRGFYNRFARYAASRGFAVLTYDYRGIGDSAPADLATSTAVYRDWGQLDVPAAIDHLAQRVPDVPLTVVGHSTGGQQLGLADNVHRVGAALFVAVSTGYWRGMPPRMRWFTYALWNVVIPVTSAFYGYTPAKRLGLGEDLPTGVAREWGDWCLQPDYLAAYFDGSGRRRSRDGRPFGALHFDRASFPLRAICFTDDPIATRANVPPLQALYAAASIQTVWIEPSQLDVREIGHLGYFRRFCKPRWETDLDWLHAASRPQVAPVSRSAAGTRP